MKFLVGTYTKKNSEGIYLVEDDKVTLYQRLFNPTYITVQEGYLFTLARGGIEIYQDSNLIYEDHSEAHSPTHIFFEPTLQMIFTANYHVGQISTYKFEGTLTKKVQTIIYPTGSHPHQCVYDANLQLLLIPDLGLDTIFTYKIDENLKLQSYKDLTLHKGVGPRHLIVSDKGNVYCLTEHSHEIYFYNKDLEFVKKYQTVDKQTAGIASAAIRMTRDQKHLYISNRGYDSITHFLINEDGTLKQKRIYPSQGKHPRDFNISLDESHIVVGNMHSNNVAIFSRDETTGDLKFIKTLPVPEPSCIIFIS